MRLHCLEGGGALEVEGLLRACCKAARTGTLRGTLRGTVRGTVRRGIYLVGACLATGDSIFATGSDSFSKTVLRSCGCFCLTSGHTVMV